MGYALRRIRLRGGNLAVESVATLPWNDRQLCDGISGNFAVESMATFAWNQWQLWCGIGGNFRAEYATGFALAALDTCFDAMCGFGHPGQCPLRRLRCSIGQIIIHLHHLLVVAVPGADHHQQFLIALLTPMGPRHHTSCDHLDHQWPFGAIAHVDPLPGLLVEPLAPHRHAVPRPLVG
jgi:hypothetical protein